MSQKHRRPKPDAQVPEQADAPAPAHEQADAPAPDAEADAPAPEEQPVVDKSSLTVEERLELLEMMVTDLLERVAQLTLAPAQARGRAKAVQVVDSQTGTIYKSKSAAGKAVAHEYGLDPTNNFAWYEVIKKAPDRFKVVDEPAPAEASA